jgi:hypothetical protein
MADKLTLTVDGAAGSAVRSNLRALETRYNNSWRQILALHSSNSVNKGCTTYAYYNTALYIGGGHYDWLEDYDEGDDFDAGGTFLWTVPETGTYMFVWRDMSFIINAGKHPSNGASGSHMTGIGLWNHTLGAFYALWRTGYQYDGTGTPAWGAGKNYFGLNGVGVMNLTGGVALGIGTMTTWASSSAYATVGNLHNQQTAGLTAYMDVYRLETGAPS